MKLSLAWIRDYVALPATCDVRQIMHDLTMATVEVEGARDLAASLAGVTVGRVVSREPAGGAPGQFVVSCDVGDAPRVHVASGDPALAFGMLVPIRLSPDGPTEALPGRPREATFCTVGELGLEGLFPAQARNAVPDLAESEGAVGGPLSTAIGWDDTVFQIDNKSLTNRPDLWCHYGIARELAAIFQLPLRPLPVPTRDLARLDLVADIAGPECARFAALLVSGLDGRVTPFWMRSRLARVDQPSINLPVDLTNYVMFAVGQPTHAYDAQRVALPLDVRFGRAGEKVTLLDAHEYSVDGPVLLVVDQDGPVAVAGVMGGGREAVTTQTTRILFEAANFDALTVRRGSTQLGLRTEASSRFEKGLDTQRVDLAVDLFINLLEDIGLAVIEGYHDVSIRPTAPRTIDVGVGFLQRRLGEPLLAEDMSRKLQSLGFRVTRHLDTLNVVVPSWRSTGDVSLPHDLVEEVARLYGYDNFRLQPPAIRLERRTVDRRALLERRLKELLSLVGGMQEVVSYPWVRDRFLQAAGFQLTNTLQLSTAPAPDQTALRPSLVPGLLESIVTNLRYYPSFRIFESGLVFPKSDLSAIDDPRERLPQQPRHLAGALVGAHPETLFREGKGLIQVLQRGAHIDALALSDHVDVSWAAKGARLGITANGRIIGSLGLLTQRVKQLAGIRRSDVVLFELDVSALEPLASRENACQSLPEHPEADFDVAMTFPDHFTWEQIVDAVQTQHPLIRGISFVDQYRGQGIPAGRKSITLRLRVGSPTRTLTSSEIAEVGSVVVHTLERRFGAVARA